MFWLVVWTSDCARHQPDLLQITGFSEVLVVALRAKSFFAP
ncbi:hypothetical protein SynMVIR181_02413 [Synechococcus sp. MVIR-18-1]|nr:hypothetical protein SynMVIR181_02413 [Synechococcus sp. MVIR-18-1]